MSKWHRSRKSQRCSSSSRFLPGVLIYAFWPGNKKRFEEAARVPLEKDPDPEQERDG